MDLTQQQYKISQLPENNKKNNFNNILASEESRVKLKNSSSDYINANYIFGDKYIATQQPNNHTIIDFWYMVHQTKSRIIINLTGENNYLPLNNINHTFHNIEVKILNTSNNENLEIRKLEVTNFLSQEQPLITYHVTFKKWKDFDIPKEEAFMRLLTLTNILESKEHKNRPIIVHCKAGVGRTGTFILIHYLYKQTQLGNYLDPLDTVRLMRKARYGMVQNNKQFNFVLNMINKLPNKVKKNNNKKISLTSSCGEIHNKVCIIKKNLSMSSDVIMS